MRSVRLKGLNAFPMSLVFRRIEILSGQSGCLGIEWSHLGISISMLEVCLSNAEPRI
jgi:hypothetical protein